MGSLSRSVYSKTATAAEQSGPIPISKGCVKEERLMEDNETVYSERRWKARRI